MTLSDPFEASPAAATIDHKTPRSRGGERAISLNNLNVALACLACNERKGDRTEMEFMLALSSPPPVTILDKNRAREEARHNEERERVHRFFRGEDQ